MPKLFHIRWNGLWQDHNVKCIYTAKTIRPVVELFNIFEAIQCNIETGEKEEHCKIRWTWKAQYATIFTDFQSAKAFSSFINACILYILPFSSLFFLRVQVSSNKIHYSVPIQFFEACLSLATSTKFFFWIRNKHFEGKLFNLVIGEIWCRTRIK